MAAIGLAVNVYWPWAWAWEDTKKVVESGINNSTNKKSHCSYVCKFPHSQLCQLTFKSSLILQAIRTKSPLQRD